jgi:hypothetical protein
MSWTSPTRCAPRPIASALVRRNAVDARTLAQLLRADLLPRPTSPPRDLRDVLPPHRADADALGAEQPRLGGPGQARRPARLRRPVPARRAAVPGRAGAAPGRAPAGGQHPGADRRLHARDGRHRPRDRHPRQRRPYVPVLCQIRGVGRYIAMLVIAEVGDITRFASAGGCARGSAWRRPCAAATARRASGTSPARAARRCAGRWSRPPSTPPAAAAPCATATSGSPSAAARSPSPGGCSPWPSTTCATRDPLSGIPSTRAQSEPAVGA